MSEPNLGHNKQRNVPSALLLILSLTLISFAALAAPPINDDCSHAWVIPGSGPFPYLGPAFEITDASTIGDPTTLPACQTNVVRSIWYSFTPTNAEFYTFSTCPDETTVADTVVALYTNALGCAAPDNFSLVACADDSSGGCLTKAVLTAALVANTPYYIVVWQYSRSQITTNNAYVKLVVSKTLPPFNDTCQNAQPLTLNLPVFGSTLAANNDYETTSDAYSGLSQVGSSSNGRDVVYTFTAPATDTYSVNVYNYSSDPNDLVVYATSFCPATGPTYTFDTVIAAANRVAGGTAEELVCIPLEQGQQIYIFVDEDTLTAGSTFRIEVNRCRLEQEGNNSPSVASPLPCGVEGSLWIRGDEDYFALGTFPVGSRAFAMVDSSATTPTSLAMQIRTNTTASANILQYAYQNNDEAFGAFGANLAGTILPPVPTFIKVYDPIRYAKEPYHLYAVVQPPLEQATVETEPNNSYAEPNSAPNNYFLGTLPNANDVDVFRFTAMGGDLIFVALDCDPLRDLTPIQAKLELLDADGKTLLSVNTSSSISGSSSSTNASSTSPYSPSGAFIYRVADEGEFDFFVRISISPGMTGPLSAGDYLLSISKNCFIGESGANTAPALANVALTTPVSEGDTVVLSGDITDPDTGEVFTLAVNWGDGSDAETLTPGAGVYTFSMSHLYADNGSYPISLTVSDNNGGTFSSNLVVTVNNTPPFGLALQVTPDAIVENNSVSLAGTFSDPGVLDLYTVSIDWGDGSSKLIKDLAAGETAFTADHVYLDDSPTATPWDTCSITVTVTDNNGGSVTSSIPLIVSNLPPVFLSATLAPASLMPGQSANLNASFSDVGTHDTFTFSVNWGDGSPVQTQATISPLSLSHVYTLANTNLTVNLAITDDDGGTVTTNFPISIQMPANPQLSIARTNGTLWLYLQGTPGATYRLQASTNLPAWFDFGTTTPTGNGHVGMSLTNSGMRFFRAVYP